MCMNIYHKKHIQNFSYTLVHHLNKKKKIKKFQIFSIISTKREDVPYEYKMSLSKVTIYHSGFSLSLVCICLSAACSLESFFILGYFGGPLSTVG